MRGILTRTAHTHGTRGDYIFLLSPPAPTTFLPERYYLSRSLQPPFSENKHQYVILWSGYLLSHRLHRLHRFSFVLRTPNLTTTYTTYTTSNGDNVAKVSTADKRSSCSAIDLGRVVLVVIVVHVVVNSNFLSLTLFFFTQKSRKVPSARAALRKRSENFCEFLRPSGSKRAELERCEFLCDIYISACQKNL